MDEKTPRRVLGREKGRLDLLADLEENAERPTSKNLREQDAALGVECGT